MPPVSQNKRTLLSQLFKKTLSTPQKLLVEAKKTLPTMKIGDVQSFLRSLPNYLRTTKMSHKKYPRSLPLRHIFVAEPFRQFFIDTWYLKETVTTHFCFAIICGFTKYLWVGFSKVLTANAAMNAMKRVINSLPPHTVQVVSSDRGSEFKSVFSQYLAENHIQQMFMVGQNKTSIGERIIR